jgi:hypothetical protein
MSTTPSNYIPLVNGTGTLVVHGEVVRVSATNTFVRALSPGALTGLVGVNGGGSIGAGGNANIFTSGAQVDVLLETGLTPVAGQTVYVSATVAGRGTNVAPGTAVTLGTIESVSQYAALKIVQVALALGTGGGTGAQGFQGSTGAQGVQGFQGVAGSGAQGAQGFQGVQGFQGSQGTQGSQGSSGTQVSLDWRENLVAFLQVNVSPTFNTLLWASDFGGAALADDGPTYAFRTLGGSNVKINTDTGGVWQLSTGAGAGGHNALAPLNAPTEVPNGRVMVWAVYARVKIISTPDANTTLALADFAGLNDVFLGVLGSQSTIDLSCGINDGSHMEVCTVATPIDINVAYHDYIYASDGTNLYAFYDFNPTPIDKRALAASMDTTTGNLVSLFIANGATAAAQIIHVDKLAIVCAQP